MPRSLGPSNRSSPRAKQPWFSPDFAPRTEHGGGIRKGRRKLSRPIDVRKPLHVTMRSTRARGRLKFDHPTHARLISRILRKAAARKQVTLMRYSNNSNHLHLLVRAKTRKGLQDFLRVVCGQIAQTVTGATRANPFGRFWDELVYSKIVEWGRQLQAIVKYIEMNILEAAGAIPYTPRRKPKPSRPALHEVLRGALHRDR